MAQLWENLLFITGGRLELSKCFWVPIVWVWKQGKPSIKKATPSSKNLSIVESETGTLIEIPRQRGSDTNKRLGVISSCDATWADQFKQLNQTAISFRDKVKRAKIGRVAGYHAYHSMWIAKIRYSAPVIGFSTRQMKLIQQRVIGPCLSSAGYCKTMPRAVVFGPTGYGGMDWDNHGVITIYEKLKMLIGSIRLQDTVGQLLGIHLSWIQLIMGKSTPLLEHNKMVQYLPGGLDKKSTPTSGISQCQSKTV